MAVGQPMIFVALATFKAGKMEIFYRVLLYRSFVSDVRLQFKNFY
jgi:hypothetical protein